VDQLWITLQLVSPTPVDVRGVDDAVDIDAMEAT